MVHQSAIDALLAQARAVLDRVEPGRLDDELAVGAVLIDIRPVEQRQRDGELTGAIIIDRNVLEWPRWHRGNTADYRELGRWTVESSTATQRQLPGAVTTAGG